MVENVTTVREYFEALATAFRGKDPAVEQDATYDAQEFLTSERRSREEVGEGWEEGELVERLQDGFGRPEEVVASYLATEDRVSQALAQPPLRPAESALGRVFLVLAEPRSYGALFYLLVSLPLGIITFTWAVTGLAVSIGLGVLIFGLFFFLFFMSTVRAVALMECRLVETLLGERMPRRPAVVIPKGSWFGRVGFWLRDGRTWLTLLYMLLRLPLGILYFVLVTVCLSIALGLIVLPFAQLFLDIPLLHIFDGSYFVPFWLFPFFWLAGAFDLLLLMHLSRAIGRWHAKLAKALLARPGA